MRNPSLKEEQVTYRGSKASKLQYDLEFQFLGFSACLTTLDQ
jgi:hypothetical protein